MEEGALLFSLRHSLFSPVLAWDGRSSIPFFHPHPVSPSPLLLPFPLFFLSLLPPLSINPPFFTLFLSLCTLVIQPRQNYIYIYRFGYRIECDALSGVVWPYDIAEGAERERKREEDTREGRIGWRGISEEGAKSPEWNEWNGVGRVMYRPPLANGRVKLCLVSTGTLHPDSQILVSPMYQRRLLVSPGIYISFLSLSLSFIFFPPLSSLYFPPICWPIPSFSNWPRATPEPSPFPPRECPFLVCAKRKKRPRG